MRFSWKYFLLGLLLALFSTVFINSHKPKPQVLSVTMIIPTPTQTPSPIPTHTPTPTLKPTQTPTSTPTPIQVSSEQINGFIEQYAREYSLDPNALRHIAVCESGFRPFVVNGPYVGLYQFASHTWSNNRKLMGKDPNPDLRRNAEESVQTAAYLLSTKGMNFWPNCKPKS